MNSFVFVQIKHLKVEPRTAVEEPIHSNLSPTSRTVLFQIPKTVNTARHLAIFVRTIHHIIRWKFAQVLITAYTNDRWRF